MNEHYAVLEERLLATLDSLSGTVHSSEIQEVRGFIEHGEYGVAFETLCAILVENGSAVSTAVAAELASLGALMGLREDVWREVRLVHE